jgi:uncharacterized membrane protein YkvA (DUF1232 family)
MQPTLVVDALEEAMGFVGKIERITEYYFLLALAALLFLCYCLLDNPWGRRIVIIIQIEYFI